ncbi:MAG: ABC transporter permease, partial [Acidobacteriaceae bacterium]|nr:ABC transporter permease [Acidobacteriaceae bacterium]
MRTMLKLWRRSKFEPDLDSELRLHLEDLTAANVQAGMPEGEARRNASLRLGNPQRLKEECHDVLWITPLETCIHDAMTAVRLLRRTRGLNVMTVLALTLGIGFSIIVFSVIYNGELHPFPYRGADRLAAIRIDDTHEPGKGYRYEFRLDEIAAFRKQSHSCEDIAGYANWYPVYAHDRVAEVLHGGALTPNAMEFFGVQPLLGRGITEGDSRSRPVEVVLLNYKFWQKQFGGDRNVVGAQMMLDGHPRTVIGVMPARFQPLGADVWMPAAWNANQTFEENEPRSFWATAILKPGVKIEAAQADLGVTAMGLARLYPTDYPQHFSITLTSLSDAVVGDFRTALVLLAAAVVLLLLLSCSNAASLLLVQASGRVKELAMRAALGASRARLVRQSLIETLLLAVLGCGAGSALAFVGLKLVVTRLVAPVARIPVEASLSLNRPTLLFAVGVSLLASLLSGLAPAIYAARLNLTPQMGGTGVGVSASSLGRRFRSGLVVCQVALSVLLLVSAGLTVQSFVALTHKDLGVRSGNLFEAWIHFPKNRYDTLAQKRKYMDQLLARVAALPGVISEAVSMGLPTKGGMVSDVIIPGKPHTPVWETMFEPCSASYFKTLDLHLVRGRLFSADEVATGRLVAVVNQTFARRYFERGDALGKEIGFKALDRMFAPGRAPRFEIAGIVSDFRNEGPTRPTMAEAFLPHLFTGFGGRRILVRTAMKPAT